MNYVSSQILPYYHNVENLEQSFKFYIQVLKKKKTASR